MKALGLLSWLKKWQMLLCWPQSLQLLSPSCLSHPEAAETEEPSEASGCLNPW